MGQLESTLGNEDLETLIEAMGDWEAIGNQEYHAMNWVKNCPIPADEESETRQYIVKLKEHFKEREKEIKGMREVRQEKAIFLKAKLMLIKRDLGIDQLFDNASKPLPTPSSPAPAPVAKEVVAVADSGVVEKLERKFALAEQYMREVGIWERFQNFAAEQTQETK